MNMLSASRRTRLLVLSSLWACAVAVGACVEAGPGSPADEPGSLEEIQAAGSQLTAAQAKALADGLTRVVGATVRPQDLSVMSSRRISGIVPFSSLLDDRSGKWVVAEVATPADATSFRAAIAAPSTWSQAAGIAGVNAAVVLSSASVRTCPTAVCFMGGCVTGMATVPDDQGCPALQCSSSAECDSDTAGKCLVSSCEDGECTTQEVDANGGPCPPAECMSSFDCAGATKDCTYKVCDDDDCTPVGVTVPAQDPCPVDECTSDSMCDLGGDTGGILQDLGY